MMHNTGSTAATADTAALTVDRPQPVWMTLNEARERAFTGEIVFEVDPEVLAYLDNGVVYYAERVSDVSLGRRLLDAGLIDMAQLERGTVRVGDIEHLGRLFDRDPSVDRDAVVVMAESSTEELIADLANRAITSVRVTAYRHHPSGVHRWFVAPLDPTGVTRPLSAVAQLDSTVVDDLPELPFGVDADELTIEWDDADATNAHLTPFDGFDMSLLDLGDEHAEDVTDEASEIDDEVFELSLDLAEYTDTEPSDTDDGFVGAEQEQAVDAEPVDAEAVDAEAVDQPVDDRDAVDQPVDDLVDVETLDDLADFEFSVVWPDGSAEPTTSVSSTEVDHLDAIDTEPTDDENTVDENTVDESTVDESTVDEPVVDADPELAFTRSDEGEIQFSMPPLTLDDEPEAADADVPDDVADAVRRAIAAIETASVPGADDTTKLPVVADVDRDDHEPPTDDGIDVGGTSPATGAPAPTGAFGGLAPPTMATRAEVLYGQMADDGSTVDTATSAPTLAERTPGAASVVFVDDPVDEDESDAGGGNERSSALRRLIGSLRRKDH